MKKRTAIILTIIIISIVSVSACLSGLYLHYENTALQVSYYNIVNARVPRDFNNYKIIQISDFHNTKAKSLTGDLITEIEDQKPDLIVLTGDFIDLRRTDIDVSIEFIKNIKDIAPIYFVSGNHEANCGGYSTLKEKLKENNVNILDNKVETLKINDSVINLIGIDDPRMSHESSVSDSLIVKTELENINYDKNNYSILLSHRPELVDVYAEKELDLVLTGHAHGGQIRIPFIGGLFAPDQGLFPEYTNGTFVRNNTEMVVSRGIGNSILPFRINDRPELVVVTLKTSL